MKRILPLGLYALILGLLLLGLVGCGVSSEDAGSTQSSADVGSAANAGTGSETSGSQVSGGSQKTLKIGSIVPFSTAYGIGIQKWMDVIVKTINDQGGWKIGDEVYNIEYRAYDGGSHDPTKTRSAVEKALLQDGVKYLVSNFADVVQTTLTVTEPNHVVDMGVDMSGAGLDPKMKYYINGSGVFFNGGMANTYMQDFIANGAKQYATAGPDNPQVRAGVKNQLAQAKSVGLEAKEPVYFAADTVDFGPVATRLMSLNTDVIDLGFTNGDQLVNLVAALKDAGYKGMLSPSNTDQVLLDKMITKVGKEYLEGAVIVSQDPRGSVTDSRMIGIFDRFVKEYGTFDPAGLLWVTSWFHFEAAVNAAQSLDPTTIAESLRDSKSPVMTLSGWSQLVARPDLKNVETIDAATASYVGKIQDGKIVVTNAVSVQDQYLASIKAYGLAQVYEAYWKEYGTPQFPQEKSLLNFSDVTK